MQCLFHDFPYTFFFDVCAIFLTALMLAHQYYRNELHYSVYMKPKVQIQCCDEQMQNVNKGRDVAKLNTRESACVSLNGRQQHYCPFRV